MRIAVVSHVRHPIAPPFMGGMEAHSWHLVDGLVRRGHDVTLMAAGDSRPPRGAALRPILDEHYDRRFPWADYHGSEALNAHVDAGFARACEALLEGGFDVVHNNSLHRYPPRLARAHRLPMVTSLHVPPFWVLRDAAHDGVAPWALTTVTSGPQRRAWWPEGAPPEVEILHNGIDPAAWPYVPRGDGSAVWAGRITPNKGTHLAAEAARLAGVPLTIYGTIEDRDYFDARVRPHLDGDRRYGGHLPGDRLAAALGRASVLLFTPLWDEPFGLAAIEAMACGLPVAAIDRGAVREVVGPAGAFARSETAEALATALRAALRVPRMLCRARVEERFALGAMIDRCEALYARARAARTTPWPERTFEASALPPTAPRPVPGTPCRRPTPVHVEGAMV